MNDDIDCTPPEIREKSVVATLDMLPKKSREEYETQHQIFLEWCIKNRVTKYSENVLVDYFAEMADKYSPPTLWSYYSMLKATLNVKNNVDIGIYKRLVPFLKQKSKSHTPKRSKTLSQQEVVNFLLNAPDITYLMMKVCTIFGIAGTCRADELMKSSVDDIQDKESIIVIQITKSKTNKPRTFIVTAEFEGGIKPIELYRKYLALRRSHVKTMRFFLSYRYGKCTIQSVGIHSIGGIPNKIASFLNLPDASLYTGHCFRRTSATLFANAGGTKENLKSHGGWKSDLATEAYVEESVLNKTKIAKTILGGVQQQTILDGIQQPYPTKINTFLENEDTEILQDRLMGEDVENTCAANNITSKSFSISAASTSGIIFHNPSSCTFTFNIYNKP